MTEDQKCRLRPLLYQAYLRADFPREQMLVRMLGQAIFGADMLYAELPIPAPSVTQLFSKRGYRRAIGDAPF